MKGFIFSIGRSIKDAFVSIGRGISAKAKFGRKGKMKTSSKIGES